MSSEGADPAMNALVAGTLLSILYVPKSRVAPDIGFRLPDIRLEKNIFICNKYARRETVCPRSLDP